VHGRYEYPGEAVLEFLLGQIEDRDRNLVFVIKVPRLFPSSESLLFSTKNDLPADGGEVLCRIFEFLIFPIFAGNYRTSSTVGTFHTVFISLHMTSMLQYVMVQDVDPDPLLGGTHSTTRGLRSTSS
jgi:hypothetical protein